jgi:LPXTG-site transpeptidase (sortase) family protein
MKRLYSIFSLALVLALLISTLPTRRVYAASFVVDTLADHLIDWSCTAPSDCTLRDAIALANWNGVPDTITFSVSGTITLTVGPLWVGGDAFPNVTVINGGGNITVVATTGNPAFQFVSAGHTLQNLTVQGNPGSAQPLIDVTLLASGVTIDTVTVQGNPNGPGIQFSSSNITSGKVTGSTIRNNAGGSGILIYDAHNVIVQNSFIYSNGQNGIAISGSPLPITSNATIDGNTIYSNTLEGINLWGANGNTIQNNYIGTNSSSTGPDTDPAGVILGNSSSGIAIANGASGNTIRNNRIAYNAYQNILVDGNGTSNNTIRNNHIYSGACRTPPANDNTGIIITNTATNNTVGPGNRIECHRYDGVQVVGTGTDNNQIVDNNSTQNASGPFGTLSASIQRNGRGISVINGYGTQPFPAIGPTNAGPNNTTIRRNYIEDNNFDGIYAVLSTNVNIGGAAADANNIRNNTGNGILIVGSRGYIRNNQVTGNGADGARIEPHYGGLLSGRDPVSYLDDVISQFDIDNNNFANNTGAGIHGLDNEADSVDDPPALNTGNTFSGNGRARVVQEWFGAVELLDASNNPISGGLISSNISSSTCAPAGTLQQYNGGAWGPSNNGLGYGPFSMTNVGTWFLILGDYVNNSGSYFNCNPYTVSASTGALSGSAAFSYDGNAFTHSVSPDPGIPYARPISNRNSRYQVAQVVLQAPPPKSPSSLPSTGFPMGRVTSLSPQSAEKAYAAYSDLTLEISSLGIKAPIVGVPKSNGTWDVSWLGNSVGWLEGSAFPTWAGNTVLTGHVWNADNTPGIFAGIKNLKYGDRFAIHAFGQTYIYEVRENTWIWGNSVSKVFKHEDYDWVTLLTCEGYNSLTGKYLFRRMVRAVLVEVK